MNSQFYQGLRKTSIVNPFETFSKASSSEFDRRQSKARQSIEDYNERKRIEQDHSL